MSSFRGLQILSRQSYQIGRIHTFSQRSFSRFGHRWRHRAGWRHSAENEEFWNRYKHKMNKFKHFKHSHRYHWGHWHEPRVIYKYYKSPISFAGMSLAMIISYNQYQSIVWALFSGFLSWIYIGYYVFDNYNKQDKSAKELLHNEIDELSMEIDKLNSIYKRLQIAVSDLKQEEQNIQTQTMQLNKTIFSEDDVSTGNA